MVELCCRYRLKTSLNIVVSDVMKVLKRDSGNMDRRWAWTVSGRFGRSNGRLTSSCLLLIFLYKNSPLVPFLSQMNPVQALLLYLKFVLTFSHLHVGLPSGLLHCPPKFCLHCSSLSHVQHAPPSSFSSI